MYFVDFFISLVSDKTKQGKGKLIRCPTRKDERCRADYLMAALNPIAIIASHPVMFMLHQCFHRKLSREDNNFTPTYKDVVKF